MVEFGGTTTEGLARTGPEELTASSVRLAQRKIERAVIQVLDRGLSESEVVPVSGQRTGVFAFVVSTVKTVLWVVRAKFHS